MQSHQQFIGTDASLEISLLEYGLLVSTEPHEDGSGSHFCVYRQGNNFGCGHIYPREIDSLLRGQDWASEKDVKGFLEYAGVSDVEQYIADTRFVNKLSDLIGYWGSENIMGTEYNPMTEEEVKFRYLYKSKDNILEWFTVEAGTARWNDPAPIEGNDYMITEMCGFAEAEWKDLITIKYNDGESEAEVFQSEIEWIKPE